ncbi:CHRD domain-containing protein [Acetobacter malorum]|uniref:CHRD domain-containing protein n=1 Tax=Acetobacter malorum TaxID=178901 RepID=UPI0012E906C6|nr:CHRD domain-containing protein [Acetobacter malorum]
MMTLPRKPILSMVLAAGLLAAGALSAPAQAQRSMLFSGTLAAEHGASAQAHGNVVALYYAGAHVLRYTVTWDGLSGPVTIAHLHGPALPCPVRMGRRK